MKKKKYYTIYFRIVFVKFELRRTSFTGRD